MKIKMGLAGLSQVLTISEGTSPFLANVAFSNEITLISLHPKALLLSVSEFFRKELFRTGDLHRVKVIS